MGTISGKEFQLDDQFVSEALVSEPSADERRREANRTKFEAAAISEQVARMRLVKTAKRIGRRQKVKRAGLAGIILSGVAAWMMFVPQGSGQYDVLSGEWSSNEMPSRSKELQRKPIGQTARLSGLDDRYVYMAMQRGGKKPVAYDPCRPIHYFTNVRTMPANGAHSVRQEIAEASKATGLVFIDDGLTAEIPGPERAGYDPELYGDRWSPVLISNPRVFT